jgi:hypothetical protein
LTGIHRIVAASAVVRGNTLKDYDLSQLKILWDFGVVCLNLPFIEKNWSVDPLSHRSRDNLPNPVHGNGLNVYVPKNTPAISDLMGLFDF